MSSPDPAWQSRSACLGSDPAIFYPERGDSSALYEARATCYGCEVKAECFEQAMTTPIEEEGVWGGRSAQERRRMRSGEIEPRPIEVEPMPPGAKRCVECDKVFMPSGPRQRFCSQLHQKRMWQRERYRSDPEWAARKKAHDYAYNAECAEYRASSERARYWSNPEKYRARARRRYWENHPDYQANAIKNRDNATQEKAVNNAHDAA